MVLCLLLTIKDLSVLSSFPAYREEPALLACGLSVKN